jgi:hypothetical protein
MKKLSFINNLTIYIIILYIYIISILVYIFINYNLFYEKSELYINTYSSIHNIINILLNKDEYIKIIYFGIDNLNNIIDYMILINYLINMESMYYAYQLYYILNLFYINKYEYIINICNFILI